MSPSSQHDRPLVIYCSACADAHRLAGDTCWHCGAVAESTTRYRSYGFVTAILIVALACGLLWAIEANHQADATLYAAEIAARTPDEAPHLR